MHEVLVELREGLLHVRESSAVAPDAVYEETSRVVHAWETRVALWTLEARLAHLGAYWRERSTARGWSPVRVPAGAPSPDARPNDVLEHGRASVLHHYHDPRGAGDTLLAALKAGEPSRFMVVRAGIDVAALDVSKIDIVHPRLPAPLMRSVMVRDQMALAQAGLPKLVSRDDYRRAFGEGSDARAKRLVGEVVERAALGRTERFAARTQEDDEVYEEFLVRISDPRLLALHHRFLSADEEDELLAAGSVAIRKAIAAKRPTVDHTQRHLLTILEASLLAREKLKSGKLLRSDPEVRALTRLAYYL